METKDLKNLAAYKVSAACKNEVKRINPFYFINQLNKLAGKNEYLDNLPLKELQARCKELHSNRYGFDACLLNKNGNGIFCVESTIKYGNKVKMTSEGAGFWVDGMQVVSVDLAHDTIVVLRPVALSLIGFLTAFQRVLTAKEKEAKAAEKAAEKAAKESEKEASNKKKQLSAIVSRFVNGEISRDEMNALILAVDLAA